MILTSGGIIDAIERGDIYIEDYDEKRLNPNSYNLRLGRTFLIYDEVTLDEKKANRYREINVSDEEGILLEPMKLYLAKTMEYTRTYNYVPKIDGRSSMGRLGVFIHVTAGFGDIGFCGNWTLELVAVHPIKLYPNTEICQISYHCVAGEILKEYQGKYQEQKEVQPSLLWRDF